MPCPPIPPHRSTHNWRCCAKRSRTRIRRRPLIRPSHEPLLRPKNGVAGLADLHGTIAGAAEGRTAVVPDVQERIDAAIRRAEEATQRAEQRVRELQARRPFTDDLLADLDVDLDLDLEDLPSLAFVANEFG